MENKQETIKSVTHCPICGTECVIGGNTTHYYIPKNVYSEEEVYQILLKHQSDYRSTVRNTSPLDWSFDIKEWFKLNKKKQL